MEQNRFLHVRRVQGCLTASSSPRPPSPFAFPLPLDTTNPTPHYSTAVRIFQAWGEESRAQNPNCLYRLLISGAQARSQGSDLPSVTEGQSQARRRRRRLPLPPLASRLEPSPPSSAHRPATLRTHLPLPSRLCCTVGARPASCPGWPGLGSAGDCGCVPIGDM